ncbi:hypothetical protein BPOR_0031g00160 [Botrytis porri]|uniref:Uncharacterized protein n=1 Tax=Botrytis porri TaxID=87229 RepID=A0A4Z1L3Q9_9HELO|nr:hypothetical protein BPOR_0031g00160 [Botrytis porri]
MDRDLAVDTEKSEEMRLEMKVRSSLKGVAYNLTHKDFTWGLGRTWKAAIQINLTVDLTPESNNPAKVDPDVITGDNLGY